MRPPPAKNESTPNHNDSFKPQNPNQRVSAKEKIMNKMWNDLIDILNLSLC